MGYLKICAVIALVYLGFDQLGLWLERRGWIYYRHKKPKEGAGANAMQEMNAFFNPAVRKVIEFQQTESRTRDDQDDDADISNQLAKLNLKI